MLAGSRAPEKVAIQGELGSNSHVAALRALPGAEIVACATSADVFAALRTGAADAAVLPIENSLHGSVFEHYDLLLEHGVSVVAEGLLRIGHNLVAAPGVKLGDIRRVLSHPVALSQCRRWLANHPQIEAVPFYDTAGSVKELMGKKLRDTAGIAPKLAAQEYGAEVLIDGVEDHWENYTRFYELRMEPLRLAGADKMSLAFSLEHRPGTLVRALQVFERAGLNLTKIESRPVHGKPWEYIFFVDLRFVEERTLNDALVELRSECAMLKELGRYRAAEA